MTFDRFNRRVHLYLAMFLLPWFFMYAVSSIPFSHASYFRTLYNDGTPQWTQRFEREYDLTLPEQTEGDREIGARILRDVGLDGAFDTYRPNPRTLFVYLVEFRNRTQVVYSADERRLALQDGRLRWYEFLQGMHARGGFRQDSFLNDAWGWTVDLVMVAILFWIASGLYMWWHLPAQRFWGSLVLAAGAGSFVFFLYVL
jgi:hypothetical protein